MRLLSGPAEGAVAVTVTSLEMTSAEHIIPVASAPESASWRRVATDKAAASRSFYERVGEAWHWVDRLSWDHDEWRAWTDRPTHHLMIASQHGIDTGYAELEQQSAGSVEVAYFGLLPEAMGRGLGRWWLAEVLAEAWRLPGTRRVWVHTCTLDGPAALATYEGRGLRPFAREVEWRLPEGAAPRVGP